MQTTAMILTLVLVAASGLSAQQRVAVLADQVAGPANHGLQKLKQALQAKGYVVSTGGADCYVLAGLPGGAAARALANSGGTVPSGAEALAVRRGTYRGKPAVILCGADSRGLMYAALDAADRISWSAAKGNPFELVRDAAEKPYLTERAISIYTMHRAYFESRLHDEQHWKRYFDMLASARINSFVIIFGYENGGYMAPLYPYFFNVQEFQGVEAVGITREQQERNTAAFKTLMRVAHERGISVTAGIWDHIYRGGVQGGGIPGASEAAGKRTPGLVWGVTADNLPSYTKAALRRFLEVFPEVDAIQFRMHDESGLKREEMAGFWHDVFGLIRRAKPDMRIDLRAKGLPDAVIEDALSQGLKARVNTKYWMEQMGLPFHPTHVNRQNQRDRRHGYADMLRYPQRYKMHWQLWSGGTTRVLLWGDPDYVRRFAQSARLYDGDSFEVNEMLATRMLGERHDAPPRPILNERYRYFDYEFERYWHFYRVWGRLSYNPQSPADVWETEFSRRFGKQAGTSLMNGLHLASKVLPRIIAASYRYQYFPTTRGWAEMQRQDDLPKFAGAEGSDTQQFMNPRDAARSNIEGADTAMRRPEETSRWFAKVADDIHAAVAQAEKAIGGRASNEFRVTTTDLKMLAGLARYHSWRLRAAVLYNIYTETKSLAALDQAIENEKRAIDAWTSIVEAAGDVYREDLVFGPHAKSYPYHWKEELLNLQQDFRQLQAERERAGGRADGEKRIIAGLREISLNPPIARLVPPGMAEPGRDLRISAKVTAPAGVKWVRLRYRHLTQYEDYQTAEMTLDSGSGPYTAAIPAAFIDPKCDLMYFVEVVDRKGAGRMYPDLEVEMPYVVVPVKR